MKHYLKKPVFPILLPFFFILHKVVENYNPSLFRTALSLILLYTLISLAVLFLFWVFFKKNMSKAALYTLVLQFIYFFFGPLHDALKLAFGGTLFAKYIFVLPFLIIAFAVFAYFLRRTKVISPRLITYLNVVLLILILIDLIQVVLLSTQKEKVYVSRLSSRYVSCDTCSKPDIHLIVADEYPGATTLKDLFLFDNSEFINELQKRGFRVNNHTQSNYNATVYSMASLLNMDYLHHMSDTMVNHKDMLICRNLINDNNVINFLEKQGYAFYNHSFFDLNRVKKAVTNPFFPTHASLLTAHTFHRRFMYNLGGNFASPQQIEKIKKGHFFNNQLIDSLTRRVVEARSHKPRFIYTHLAMPHHPYYVDRNGNEVPFEQLNDHQRFDKKAFIEYLIYTNKQLLNLIDHIRRSSSQPPIIILISDHGFRQYATHIDRKYYFLNLNAIYLPNGNYSKFYDGMTNVNQFRALLNTQFGLRLPLLKDSISFMQE